MFHGHGAPGKTRKSQLKNMDPAQGPAAQEEPEEPHAPVIFLDIDGVLNRTRAATHIRLDDDLVTRLSNLVAETDAAIVLSTFWRPFQTYVQYILCRYGIPAESVIGRTPGVCEATSYANGSNGTQLFSTTAFDDKQYCGRAAEIHAWLDAHPRVTRYVVLDDRASASDERLAARFVQTVSDVGLSEEDAARCRELLSEDANRAPARAASGQPSGSM